MIPGKRGVLMKYFMAGVVLCVLSCCFLLLSARAALKGANYK